jgi:hypothetical protein
MTIAYRALATVAAATLTIACAHQAPATFGAPLTPEVQDLVAVVRAATTRFRSLDSAAAAGYARTVARCYIMEHHGAMGYHHVNRSYVDSVLDPEHPEILLYERAADSSYRLTAIEFIVPYRLWPAESDSIPTVRGQRLHRVDEVSVWGLHLWLWKENPAGLFADWNPTVSCPPGTPNGLR